MMGIRPVPVQQDLRVIFDMYDTDTDGYINWEELCSEHHNTGPQPPPACQNALHRVRAPYSARPRSQSLKQQARRPHKLAETARDGQDISNRVSEAAHKAPEFSAPVKHVCKDAERAPTPHEAQIAQLEEDLAKMAQEVERLRALTPRDRIQSAATSRGVSANGRSRLSQVYSIKNPSSDTGVTTVQWRLLDGVLTTKQGKRIHEKTKNRQPLSAPTSRPKPPRAPETLAAVIMSGQKHWQDRFPQTAR